MFRNINISNKLTIYFVLIVGISLGAMVFTVSTIISSNLNQIIDLDTSEKAIQNAKTLNTLIEEAKRFVRQVDNYPNIGKLIKEGNNPLDAVESYETFLYLSNQINNMKINDDYSLNCGYRIFDRDYNLIGKLGAFGDWEITDTEKYLSELSRLRDSAVAELVLDTNKTKNGLPLIRASLPLKIGDSVVAVVIGGFYLTNKSLIEIFPNTDEVTLVSPDKLYDTTFINLFGDYYINEEQINKEKIKVAFEYIEDEQMDSGLEPTLKQKAVRDVSIAYNKIKELSLNLIDDDIRIVNKAEIKTNNGKTETKVYDKGIYRSLYIPYSSKDKKSKLVLISHNPIDEFKNIINQFTLISLIAGIIAVILAVVVIRIVAYRIGKKITYISKVLIKASSGDLSIRAITNNRSPSDELTKLYESINTLLRNNSLLISSVKENNSLYYQSSNELDNILTDIERSISCLKEKITITLQINEEQSDFLKKIDGSVQRIVFGFNNIYSSLKVQNSYALTITENIEEIKNNTTSIADTSSKAKDISMNLKKFAITIVESTNDLFNAINGIESDSNDILDIVTVITNIADQTNMLAMNASIEAAHAGDVGSGFSVVADEIRQLSENSSKKAKEIKNIIKNIVNKILNSVTLAKHNEENIHKILNIIENVYNTNANISETMEKQSENIKKVVEDVNSSKKVTVELTEYSKTQSDIINQFQKEINTLLGKNETLKESMIEEEVESNGSIEKINSMKKIRKENSLLRSKLDESINKFKIDIVEEPNKEQTQLNILDTTKDLIGNKKTSSYSSPHRGSVSS